MATLDQILLRLPRKAPDAGFVDRVFGQIHGKGTLSPTPSITHQDLFPFGSERIELAQSAMQEDAEFMQTDANLYPSPVMQKEPSPDIYRFATLSPPDLSRFSP